MNRRGILIITILSGLAFALLVVKIGAVWARPEITDFSPPQTPQGLLTGVILTPESGPITATSQVWLFQFKPDGNCCTYYNSFISSPSGNFSIDLGQVPPDLFPGIFFVIADAPYPPYKQTIPVSLTIASPVIPQNIGPIRLTYPSFQGHVHDPSGLAPAPYGRITANVDTAKGLRERAWTTVNQIGEYSFGGVPDGIIKLIAVPSEDSIFWNSIPLPANVIPGSQYTPGATQPISFSLQAPNLTGWVVYPSGLPVTWTFPASANTGRAFVEAQLINFNGMLERPTAGWGQFGLLLGNNDYWVWADPRGVLTNTLTRSIPIALNVPTINDTGNLTLTYPTVSGRLIDSGGQVIPECFEIKLARLNSPESSAYTHFCGTPTNRFRLGGVPAGDYLLTIWPQPGSSFAPPSPFPITVNPGDPYDPGKTLVIDITLNLTQIYVEVQKSPAVPISGTVHLWNDAGEDYAQYFTPGNPVRFAGLTVGGVYWLQAWPPGNYYPGLANSPVVPVIVSSNPQNLRLTLQSPNLVGKVTSPEGTALPPAYDNGSRVSPASVHAFGLNRANELWGPTDQDGNYSLHLPLGNYTFEAVPNASLAYTYTRSISLPVSIPIQNDSPFNETRLTYPSVKGRVTDPYGMPTETWVDLFRPGSFVDQSRYQNDGVNEKFYNFGGLRDGQYFLRAAPPMVNPNGYGPSQIETFFVTLGSQYLNNPVNIPLTLTQPSFYGQLFYPCLNELPDCNAEGVGVLAHNADWSSWDANITSNAGQFYFYKLAAGVYTLEFFIPDAQYLNWDPPAPPVTFTIVAPNQPPVNVEYTLQSAVKNKHLLGKIALQDGTPVPAEFTVQQPGTGRRFSFFSSANGDIDQFLKGGVWEVTTAQPYDPIAGWYFDPANTQWAEFSLDAALPETATISLTLTSAEFYTITGQVEAPGSIPPPPATTVIQFCTDSGLCFSAWVDTNGGYTINAPAMTYRVWIWVDPGTGLLPPANNGFLFTIQGNDVLPRISLRDQSARSARVSGQLLDPTTGTGLGNLAIAAWTDEGDWVSTVTDPNGYYIFSIIPGFWHGGPALTREQEQQYLVLPPHLREGEIQAGEVITNVNFYIRSRDATISGQIVDELGHILPDANPVVFALYCGGADCWPVAVQQSQGGSFQLQVPGGITYTVGIWLPGGGYIPGSEIPRQVYVDPGQTFSTQFQLLTAGTRIHGSLVDQQGNPVQIQAAVFGSNGQYWTEDFLWPEKFPYEYNLYVPTPISTTQLWYIGLGVDPATGYIVDPAHAVNQVVIDPGRVDISYTLHVQALDAWITGTVTAGGHPASFLWVYAQGTPGGGTEGLYFEAQADANGNFTIPVVNGAYVVGAYLPPDIPGYFPPVPITWTATIGNPITLDFRLKGALTISGGLAAPITKSLPGDAPILVFGSSNAGYVMATGNLATGYILPISSNTTWTVWAVFEDPLNHAYYYSQPIIVKVGQTSVPGINLNLAGSGNDLAATLCWTFDSSQAMRLELPPRGNLAPPVAEIPAGTFPVTGEVEVCATPKVALPGGQDLIGFGYELEARDSLGNRITQNFNHDIRLSFTLDWSVIPLGANPAGLLPVYYSPSRQEWVPLKDVFIDPVTLQVSGKINHFSRMGVKPPRFLEEIYQIALPLVLKN